MKEIEIRVLTPAFFSRFVHYAHTAEAFDRECIFTDEKNRTCWISRPELLAQLLDQSKPASSESTAPNHCSGLDKIRWSLLVRLRCAPAEPAYNPTPKSSGFRLEDIRAARFSELDGIVRSQHGQTYAGEYRRIVTKLFLAQLFCSGFPQIISVFDWILRGTLCYLAARQVSNFDEVTWSALLNWEWWPLLRIVGVVSASHAYGLFKGYR